ncbi:tape measure protein [Morganella morganii subsp. morganii]|nr:tape measure protein [Morganella morganii]MBA5836612.1 tape measure protein [Morganella morganii]MBT0449588.1 tape measure protein [Morganella morganii subsp. morganii]MBV0430500.1 tape measure protein [Morganella morganii subsp. morganii]MDT5426057.1 tape measure protein [Morganella morganii]HCR3552932.1 tape measure protein [Morganella morganii]
MANVGEIVYQVQMDVAQLLTSQRQLDQRLRNMEGGFNRTTTAVNGTERSMSSLSRVAASLTAYLSASAVASYAESWTVLNNKLSNSVRASESLVEVTERVFNISQDTRSSLDATATLYARLERGTRQYNTSAEDLAKLTTIINQGFIVSGATAQEAENAIIQLSQGIASGVLRGEEFNSVSEQGSRLMVALADSMGVSIGQLRAMAAEGKLTTDVVVNGLLSQGAAIGEEFSKTTQTMSQALQEAGNNITKFFGNSSTVQSFIGGFNDSVVVVSENLDSLTNILVIAAGVIGSRYAGALALAGAAQVKKARDTMAGAAASRQAAVAERDAAAVLVRKTVADRDAAMSALNLARAEYQVARGSAAEATALANVTRLKTAYSNAAIIAAQANNTLSASQARVAATGLTMANALKSMNWLLAPIGGPAGAAMLAGAAVYYFFQKTEEARQEASKFADELEGLTEKMQGMNRVQLEGMIAKATQHMSTQKDEIKELGSEIDSLNERYKKAGERNYSLAGAESDRAKILNEIKIKQAELDTKTTEYSRTLNSTGLMQAKLNGELLQGADLLKAQSGSVLPNASAALKAYGLNLEDATRAKQRFNATSLTVERSQDGDKLLENLRKQNELLAITDDRQRAIATAKQKAEEAGVKADSTQMQQIENEAARSYDLADAKKETVRTSKAAASAAAKEATEAEKLKQKITDLANATKVAELETKGLSREAAILEAVQKLGSKANAAQIAEITELAGKEYDLTQKIKDRKDAFEQNPRVKADQDMKLAQEQLERQLKGKLVTEEQYQQRRAAIYAEYSRKISEETSNGQVNIVAENRAKIDPVQALANENAQKLALMESYYQAEQALLKKSQQDGQISHDQYIAAKQATDAQYMALKTAQDKQYQEQQIAAQWQLLSQQSLGYDMLTSAVDSLSGNASNAITGLITQTMSWGDAARSLGNTMLNSVVNSIVQVGVEMAKNFILGQTLGVATQAANASAAVAGGAAALAAWTPAAIAASIATMGAASASGLGAYTAAQATGAATSIGMKALTIAGARKDGGPVSAGEMYRVGEGGKPEIFKASNGNQYMIPGDNGKVISNRDIGGGQIPVTVNINDYSSGGSRIDAQARQDSNGMTIDVFIADMDNKGPMHSAITRNTTASARVR